MLDISAVEVPSDLQDCTTMAGYNSFNFTDSQRLVNRLKNTNYEKFSSLVQMHLSFLLDLSGSSLEEFLCPLGLDSSPESMVSKFFSFGKRRCHKEKEPTAPGIIFGQPLCQEAIEAMYPLMEFLKKDHCLEEEGLFRKSGQAVRQRSLQDSLNTNQRILEQIEEDLHNGIYTAHDCASIIKMYLRELPEPLLTNKHYIAYCQIPGMNCQKRQIQTMQLLVQLLPQENFIFLQLLLELLDQVALKAANKMTADTLATLIAPHVFVPRTTNANELHAESCNVIKVMSLMIQHHRQLFTYPDNLISDIRLYWDEMEGGMSCSDMSQKSGFSSDDELDQTCSCPKLRKRADPVDDAINTTVYFADRGASSAVDVDYTNKQIAQLYAYVRVMPDSPKKRKLVKQFNKFSNNDGTPVLSCERRHKHKRTTSSLDSIKRVITKTPKRKNSYDLPQQDTSSSFTNLSKNESIMDGTTTPKRGSTGTFRRHIEQTINSNCGKLSMAVGGSGSQSSLSSTESCESCSVNSDNSGSGDISTKAVFDTCSKGELGNTRLCLTMDCDVNSVKLTNSGNCQPISNILKQGLIPQHICMDDIEGDEKENSVGNITPTTVFCTPERNSVKDCNCNISKKKSSTHKRSLNSFSSETSAPVPKCIRT